MKKRKLIWLSLLATACLTAGALASCGESAGTEGLEYELSSDGSYYILTSMGVCTDKEVTVAEKHDGKPVKAIAEEAF